MFALPSNGLAGKRLGLFSFRLLYCLLLLLSSQGVAAQTVLADYYQDVWTTRNGLPHNSINSITQTPDGYLWFATWEGAVRYNGREFRVFERGQETGLPDSGLRSLALDRDGGLLVAGARGGITKLKDRRWQAAPPLPAMVAQVLADHQGNLWFGTEGDGVYLRTPNQALIHYDQQQGLPGDSVYSLLDDGQGRVWIGTSAGLAFFDGKVITPVADIPAVSVLALQLNRQGQLLVGSEQGVYIRRETGFVPLRASLQRTAVSAIMLDEQEDLWLGTLDQGLLRLGPTGIERLDTEQGLPNNRVTSLFQDREHSIWVGTNGGLFRLRDAPFTSYTQDKGLAGNYVRTVMTHSDGTVWVGTSSGLSRMVAGRLTTLALTMPDGTEPSILSLAEGKGGELWVGTYTHGLLRLHNGRLVARFDREAGLGANEIRAIIQGRDGTLWVGTSKGLSTIREGVVQTYTQRDGLPGEFIMSLYEAHNGDIWIGTGVGVGLYRDGKLAAIDLHSQENAEYAFGFYQEPDGRYMWITTDRGLVRYRYADAQLAVVGRRAGLPIEKMFQVVADRLGTFWLTTNRGMLRIAVADAHRVAEGELERIAFELFTESDGMASAQANGGSSPAASLGLDGAVWIATAKGVAVVKPERVNLFGEINLPVTLESLAVNGEEMPLAPQLLAAGSDRVALRYAGLGYVLPQLIQYRTRLEGFDSDWVNRDTQHIAEYTNLPPGDYVFRVAAAYPYGKWSEQEVRLPFTLLPFWWQRPLFWFLLVLLGMLLLAFAIVTRIRSLNRHAEQLRQQVADKTRELQLQAQAFESQAREDPLTGLANRRAFDGWLSRSSAENKRSGRPLALAILDIDHFKQVNDRWSHAVGDRVIKAVAEVLRVRIRESDYVARWGGEEFTLLFPDTDVAEAKSICEHIRQAVALLDNSRTVPGLTLTVSIGVAVSHGQLDGDKLLSEADQALYQAKDQGRNRVVLWPAAG